MKKLIADYNKKKNEIKHRLKEFKDVYKKKDIDIFAELCFCILTPQSKAIYCDKAIRELKKESLLIKGSRKRIGNKLRGLARFHNNKASYIVDARKKFKNNNKINIKRKLEEKDIFATREWLVKNIKGLGYKEASHFLRNIGMGHDVAILDVHILRNLKKLGIVKKLPLSISKNNYIDIENRMRNLSRKISIPLGELDLLFWSAETGFVFK